MNRYIDADKTLAYISRLLGGLPFALLIEYEKNGIDIVRCKECKFENTRKCPPHRMGLIHEPDDFCSYGEREAE